jgi:hypothetical protein
MSVIINPNDPVPEEKEDIPYDERVRYVGDIPVSKLPPLLAIKAGITEATRIEVYISDSSGKWMLKYSPHHDFEEKAWRERRKAQPELNEPVPFRTVYTNSGLMIRIDKLPEDEFKELIFDIVLKDFSLFPEREKDPWEW